MKLQDYLKKYGNVSVDEKELNKVLGVKPSRWTLEHGEFYWYVHASGEVRSFDWVGDEKDLGILNYSEVYKTRKEAEFARDKQKFLLQMKRDFEDNTDEIDWGNNTDEIDWGNGSQGKYYFDYHHGDGTIKIHVCNRLQTQGTLYTTNYNWLKQYIEDNEDDIKKYVFNIKGEQ